MKLVVFFRARAEFGGVGISRSPQNVSYHLPLDFEQRPIRVVAVDDSPTALTIAEAACTNAGFEFYATTDPLRADVLVRAFEPDVILLDVQMPELDGFEICAHLKAQPETQLIPVVLVTALDSRDDKLMGLDAGCDDFMSKPVDLVELVARVESLARMRRLTENLDDATRVLESLAKSVEAKDGITGTHCDRLVAAGELFGRFLKLSVREIAALKRSGVLHDIGKIGVPDAVLLKPGKLDEDEWRIMKLHPTVGADLISPLRTMAEVVPVVRHHHERWDGRGYPDGLAGEDIPKLARVFQLPDAFDALVSPRPYKPAMTIDSAKRELSEMGAAGSWDPSLLDAFLNFLDQTPAHPWVEGVTAQFAV